MTLLTGTLHLDYLELRFFCNTEKEGEKIWKKKNKKREKKKTNRHVFTPSIGKIWNEFQRPTYYKQNIK